MKSGFCLYIIIGVMSLSWTLKAKADDKSDISAIAKEAASKALKLKDEGRYKEADDVYNEAFRRIGDSSLGEYKQLKLNWCELYLRRGMYSTVNDTLDSFKSQDKESPRWNRLKAVTLTYMGRLEEADAIYGDFIDGFIPTPKGDNLWDIYSNRSFLYVQRGLHGQAAEWMSKAINILETKAPSDLRDINIIRSNLAVEKACLDSFGDAEKLIGQAMDYFRNVGGTDNPEYIITLRKWAEILLMEGKIKEATDVFADYVESERRQAIREFALLSEQKRLDYWANKRPLISEIFQTEKEKPGALFDVSVFRREVALLGGADSTDIPRRLSLRGDDIREALKKGEVAIDFIKYSKDSLEKYAAIVAYPIKDSRKVEFIPLWTEDDLNGYKSGTKTLKDAVCSKLSSDKNAIYGDSMLAKMILGPILPYIDDAKDAYFCPDGLINMLAIEYLPLEETGIRLHRLTSFSKIVDRKKNRRQKGKMLAIGGLDYNKDAEKGENSGKGNHDAIDYLHQNVGKGVLFPYLEGTKDEIAAIDSLTGNAIEMDTAFQKTEAQLKVDLADETYSSAHLSTHGYSLYVDVAEKSALQRDSLVEDKSLLASGIALSGANVAYKNEGNEDGILSARELCDMKLKHIDLIVLSACQTGLGVVSDEGPAGLVRGLKKSGANTIIATLWEVDDEATKLMMTFLYKISSANPQMGIYEALREAQDSLRNLKLMAVGTFNPATLTSSVEYVDYEEGEGIPITPYEDPYYWAPFIVIDDYIKK